MRLWPPALAAFPMNTVLIIIEAIISESEPVVRGRQQLIDLINKAVR